MLKQQFVSAEQNVTEIFLGSIAGVSFLYGIICKTIGFAKPNKLRGKLEGFITFEHNAIIVEKQIYRLEEVKKIEISNEDYYGRMIATTGGDFNSPLSNGVDNKLQIVLITEQVKSYYFEMYNPDDLQKVKNELINYCRNGKLPFSNLTYLLGIDSEEELQEMKKIIQI
jgi:hypothetical protein